MKRIITLVIILLMCVPAISQAKTPSTLKGYIKLAQKAYPGHCTNHIRVKWDTKRSELGRCDISLQRDYWKIADKHYKCLDVVLAVGNLEGHHGAATAKGCPK